MKAIIGIFKETFKGYSEDKVPRLAAALSYYAAFSIAPLLVLVIAVFGFIIGSNSEIRSQILSQIQQTIGPQAAKIVDTLITNVSQQRSTVIATIIGAVAVLLGATGLFAQLEDSLNTIWEVTPNPDAGVMGIVRQRLAALLMILVLGVLFLLALGISIALPVVNQYFTNVLGQSSLISMLENYGIQLVIFTLVFAAIFKWVPDVKIRWRSVWVGALFTAVLFLIGQFLFSLYLSKASPSSIYGAAGSLVVLLLWFYYSAQMMFLGAEFTKAYSYARKAQIIPADNARMLMPDERIQQGIARPGDEESARQAPGARASQIPVSGDKDNQPQDRREQADSGQAGDQNQ